MNVVTQKMQQHASVRKYQDAPIDHATISQLVTAAQHAASSHFVQAYSVIHVTDAALKQQLAELSGNRHVASCGAFLVFCADLKRLAYACAAHGAEIESATAENTIVATVDVALLAQNFALAAESEGYGICYIGGIRNQPEAVSALLAIPDQVYPVFGMAIGVPAEANAVKPRLPVAAVLHENGYSEAAYPEQLQQYDEIMTAYYQNRGSNQKMTTWTQSMAVFMAKKQRPHMKAFLQGKGWFKE